MEIKSVRKSTASIPTLEDTLSNPVLLEKNAPARWLKNGAVAGALSVYLLAGCKSSDNAGDEKHRIELSASEANNFHESVNDQDTAAKKIAPIFVHGDGSAAFGCVVSNSPVFISEDEARSIITKEFKKHGIKFSTIAPCITANIKRWEYINSSTKAEPISKNVDINLDGYNEDINLVYAFISSEDGKKLDDNSGITESISGISTLYSAEIVIDEIKRNNYHNAVVFYDPLEDKYLVDPKTHKLLNDSEDDAKKRAKKHLQAQVADFIVWAKKEGLIK